MQESKDYRATEIYRLQRTSLVLLNAIFTLGVVHYTGYLIYKLVDFIF